MNHAVFDNTSRYESDSGPSGNNADLGGGDTAALLGNRLSQECVLLKAECERLSKLVKELEKERDAYLKALYYYMTREITREELEETLTIEDGVPFEVLAQDMERILQEAQSTNKS